MKTIFHRFPLKTRMLERQGRDFFRAGKKLPASCCLPFQSYCYAFYPAPSIQKIAGFPRLPA
jgi:hypothetical protein